MCPVSVVGVSVCERSLCAAMCLPLKILLLLHYLLRFLLLCSMFHGPYSTTHISASLLLFFLCGAVPWLHCAAAADPAHVVWLIRMCRVVLPHFTTLADQDSDFDFGDFEPASNPLESVSQTNQLNTHASVASKKRKRLPKAAEDTAHELPAPPNACEMFCDHLFPGVGHPMRTHLGRFIDETYIKRFYDASLADANQHLSLVTVKTPGKDVIAKAGARWAQAHAKGRAPVVTLRPGSFGEFLAAVRDDMTYYIGITHTINGADDTIEGVNRDPRSYLNPEKETFKTTAPKALFGPFQPEVYGLYRLATNTYIDWSRKRKAVGSVGLPRSAEAKVAYDFFQHLFASGKIKAAQ